MLEPARPRKLAKVPFVELADGRVQGVVSSGSDIARVYVSSVAAGSFAVSCSTNNNRPCGGGGHCKHISGMIQEAVLQYGQERVARYLRLEVPSGSSVMQELYKVRTPASDRAAAASVFSRFLRHLAYLELSAGTAPLPEMQWFPPVRAVA
ncbi:hypothetical protein [Longispora albida]|uniref:hypothetical protein n=1 Tax=Longispora albida TaxID=203523 RepID=UPI00036DAF56